MYLHMEPHRCAPKKIGILAKALWRMNTPLESLWVMADIIQGGIIIRKERLQPNGDQVVRGVVSMGIELGELSACRIRICSVQERPISMI